MTRRHSSPKNGDTAESDLHEGTSQPEEDVNICNISITRSSLRRFSPANKPEDSQALIARRSQGASISKTKKFEKISKKKHLASLKSKPSIIKKTVENSTRSGENKKTPEDGKRMLSKGKSEEKKQVESDNDISISELSSHDPKTKPTVLLDWVIKPVPDCRGICVEGQIQGLDDFWHSTAIVEALKPNLVRTATGSVYKLVGKMNRLLSMEYGIAKDVVKSFALGFPRNWEEVIRDYYQDMEQSITVTQECLSPKKFQLLKTKQRSIVEKAKTLPVDTHTILTPTGLLKKEMNMSELTTTRSGRMSLPPLAGWAGQYYVKVPGTNSVQVSFNTDCAKQAQDRETMHALALSKRNQMMLCGNSLSKSVVVSPNPLAVSNTKNGVQTMESSNKNVSTSKSAVKVKNIDRVSDLQHLISPEKEKILDRSFQPEVRLVDCQLSHMDTKKLDNGMQNLGQTNQSKQKSDWIGKMTRRRSYQKQDHTEESPIKNSGNHHVEPKAPKQSKVNQTENSLKEATKKTRHRKDTGKSSKTGIAENVETECAEDEGNSLVALSTSSGGNSPSSPGIQTHSFKHSDELSAQEQKNELLPLTTGAGTSAVIQKPSQKKRKADVDHNNSAGNDKSGRAEVDGKAKRQKLDATSTHESDCWTQSEKTKFHRALRDVNGDEADYWHLVSHRVGTRSEHECQRFHKQFLEAKSQSKSRATQSKPQKAAKKTGRLKGGPIRGGKGTLKRKQDIRDFLDEQNEGYEDDLFEATPFVKMKRNPLMQEVAIDFNKEDSEIFGSNHNFFTPVAGKNPFDTPSLRFRAKLASVRKTPTYQAAAFHPTPLSDNRRQHDLYIKNFMDKKKKSSSSKHVSPPVEDLETSILPIKSLFPASTPQILMDNLVIDDQNDDEEGEDDDDENNGNQFLYYWSDGD
ncbi:mis18-binding protein 1 [Plakobranchus ocellatus]|uniref:Mis18-binding protein 1 n=1 Tax=Plakobranchus ocellatus TaxID=259542 RepID=A0AAV4AXH3_9GAST|nr:mis18-binding protein 1 [Plakobranchus ocellatus]